jgi:hypothetical protein
VARLEAELYAGIASGLVAFERPPRVARGSTPLAEALRPLVQRDAAPWLPARPAAAHRRAPRPDAARRVERRGVEPA